LFTREKLYLKHTEDENQTKDGIAKIETRNSTNALSNM